MIIISGPSTIGKNPLIEKISSEYCYDFLVPWTTRQRRKEEINGRDYHFLPKEEFRRKILDGSIIEWDYCLANYYGYSYFDPTAANTITHGLSRMATRIKNRNKESVTTIFLMPQETEKVFSTLKKIYTGEDLVLRLQLVEEEINHSPLFDYVFTIKESVYEVLENKQFLSIVEKKHQMSFEEIACY